MLRIARLIRAHLEECYTLRAYQVTAKVGASQSSVEDAWKRFKVKLGGQVSTSRNRLVD
jgi:hypothetical protein